MNSKNLGSLAKDSGFNVSENFLKDELQNLSYNDCMKKLLNHDQRNWGLPVVSQDEKGKLKTMASQTVLQILNITNISAPKANSESNVAPRLLKLILTDGKNIWNGLEVDHIKTLSLKTAPGTKIKLTSKVAIINGYMLFTPLNIQILGGVVNELFDDWKLSQSISKYKRVVTLNDGTGPPSWVAFGKEIIMNKEKNFKSLETKLLDEGFETQRKQAVQVITGGESNKKFGGGKQMLDTNVQKVVNAGFSVSDAEWALKKNRNDAHRAVMTLKGTETKTEFEVDIQNVEDKRGGRKTRFGKKNRGYYDSDEENELALASAPRPSGPASLVDYLENRISDKTARESQYTGPYNKPFNKERPSKNSPFDRDLNKKYKDENPITANYWPSLGQENKNNPSVSQQCRIGLSNEKEDYKDRNRPIKNSNFENSTFDYFSPNFSWNEPDEKYTDKSSKHYSDIGDYKSPQNSYSTSSYPNAKSHRHSNRKQTNYSLNSRPSSNFRGANISSNKTSGAEQIRNEYTDQQKELISNFEKSMIISGCGEYQSQNEYENNVLSYDEHYSDYYPSNCFESNTHNSHNYRATPNRRRGRRGFNKW